MLCLNVHNSIIKAFRFKMFSIRSFCAHDGLENSLPIILNVGIKKDVVVYPSPRPVVSIILRFAASSAKVKFGEG